MLALEFQIGSELFALDAQLVVEVLPAVPLTSAPLAATGIIGLLNYHGVSIPVLDLRLTLFGEPTERSLNSRLVIIHGTKEGERAAVLTEGGARLKRLEAKDISTAPVEVADAGFLGGTYIQEPKFGRFLHLHELLSDQLRQQLRMNA